jgi:hypothetical protein
MQGKIRKSKMIILPSVMDKSAIGNSMLFGGLGALITNMTLIPTPSQLTARPMHCFCPV